MSSTSSSPLVESIMSLETPVLLGLAVGTISVLFLAYTILLKPKKEPAMSPTDFRKFKLVEKESLSHDTRKFTFELQTPETVLGLPVGQHITLRFQDSDGKRHQRCVIYKERDRETLRYSFTSHTLLTPCSTFYINSNSNTQHKKQQELHANNRRRNTRKISLRY